MSLSALNKQPEILINTNRHQQGQPRAIGLFDWLLYIPFGLAFVGSLVFFDILQRCAVLFGNRAHERVIDALNAVLVLILKIVRVRVRVRYSEPISGELPIIVMANHQSLYDIPILHSIFRHYRPKFVAKRELARWIPSVSFNLRHGGGIIIDRRNPRQSIAALKSFSQTMVAEGVSLVIFPEGTRSRDGKTREFHSSGVETVLRHVSKAQIIPVSIKGSNLLYPYRLGPVRCGVRVAVRVHKPILWDGTEKPGELLRRVSQAIANDVNFQTR